MKRKGMDNSSRKCQKEFITIDLGNGYPKVTLEIGTEALLCAAQEQAIRRNFVKSHIVKTSESPLCRLCGKKVKVCNTWSVDVKNWLRENIRDDKTM